MSRKLKVYLTTVISVTLKCRKVYAIINKLVTYNFKNNVHLDFVILLDYIKLINDFSSNTTFMNHTKL